MARKGRPFLTVYTVTKTTADVIERPFENETLGSWILRGDAIRECTDKIMQDISTDPRIRAAVYTDDNHPSLRTELEKAAPADVVGSFFLDKDPAIWKAKTSPWQAYARAIARTLVDYISDELGGQGCYIVQDQYSGDTYRYEITENDVEGTMEAWTCVTTGETDEPDEDFETAFPEVFLSEGEAVKCALDDLQGYLKDKGAKPNSVKKILEEARKSLARCGVFQCEVRSGAVRRWDIWHTPVTLSGKLPKTSLTRRKDRVRK